MFSNGNQEFGDKNNVTLGNINYKTTDVYVLYRNAKNLGYFELGPKLSFLNSIDMTPTGGESVDLKAYNEKNNIAAVIGFGANIMGTDGRFSGILGLRFEYGLKNMNNADAIAVGSPVFDQGLLYADGESSTNPVFAGVVFELNWGVGYFGKAQCGGRSKFIMF